MVFVGRPSGRRPRGGRSRLRSGAFAPDFPFVILVLAFGDSFGFPRAHRGCPPRGRLPEGLRASWPVALLDLWSGKGIFWTPIVAARAAAIGVGVSASDAGALRAGLERFSNGSARREVGRWWSARQKMCCA